MDVAGAFNNVHHQRLIHNLRERRISIEIIKWIESFLSEKSTALKFNGTTTDAFQTTAGVPQGSSLSPILYILYNSNLLDIPNQYELGLGFIDDIAYGVKGDTAAENAGKLENMLAKAEIWRRKHEAQFEKSKYMLVHFTRSQKSTAALILLDGITINPVKEAKYLGVIFEKDMRFRAQLNLIVKKGTNFASAIIGISRSK